MHGNGSESMTQNSRSLACNIWGPPLAHYLKYNVDSAFFTDLKMVGVWYVNKGQNWLICYNGKNEDIAWNNDSVRG